MICHELRCLALDRCPLDLRRVAALLQLALRRDGLRVLLFRLRNEDFLRRRALLERRGAGNKLCDDERGRRGGGTERGGGVR